MTATVETSEPWRGLVGYVLARRDQKGGFRSEVRSGLFPHSEHQALPHVAPYSVGTDLTALLRAAAIVAEHRRAPNDTRQGARIGQSLRALYRVREGNDPGPDMTALARRVTVLPFLPLQEAAQAFDSLVTFCAAERVPVAYYDLTRTLLHWGQGVSAASLAVRRQVIADFYTPTRTARSDTADTTA